MQFTAFATPCNSPDYLTLYNLDVGGGGDSSVLVEETVVTEQEQDYEQESEQPHCNRKR